MKVLVTGGTNGMGKGVAKALAGMDAQAHEVILLSRSKDLCESAVQEIEQVTEKKRPPISFATSRGSATFERPSPRSVPGTSPWTASSSTPAWAMRPDVWRPWTG